jgi:CarD family transcriptional regulator
LDFVAPPPAPRKARQKGLMMFSVGDKVMHPGHGPGVITGVETRQVIGDAKEYYIIEMLAEGGTLMTPVARAEEIGLRPAIDLKTVERLFGLFTESPTTLSSDFRERQDEIEERLRVGDVFTAAEVLRDLAWYSQDRGLTERDTKLMQRAEESLGGELALVYDIEVDQAIKKVQARLAEVMEERVKASPPLPAEP